MQVKRGDRRIASPAGKFLALSVALALVGVAGACAKPIPLQKVTLVPHDGGSGEDSSGLSYLLLASISSDHLTEIVDNHLHAYVFLEKCDDGEFISGVLPNVDGIEITEFDKITLLMRQQPKPVYSLSGTLVVDRELVGRPICATLSGGGYTLVKIRRQKIPVEWTASS
jgi:hypothetical protein